MKSPGLLRISGAILYDISIVIAIIFIAALWFPLIPQQVQDMPLVVILKRVYYFGLSFLYFAYSWRLGGQTIGMKSWRIKLVSAGNNEVEISWTQCLIRYLVAILPWIVLGQGVKWLFLWLGIETGMLWVGAWLAIVFGFVWLTFRQGRSLQDKASGTCLLVIPKKA